MAGAACIGGSRMRSASDNCQWAHGSCWPGDGNDHDPILTTVGSTTPNNAVTLYSTRDVHMSGQVKFTGSGNDRDPILVNVGSTTPNNVRTQQVP